VQGEEGAGSPSRKGLAIFIGGKGGVAQNERTPKKKDSGGSRAAPKSEKLGRKKRRDEVTHD